MMYPEVKPAEGMPLRSSTNLLSRMSGGFDVLVETAKGS